MASQQKVFHRLLQCVLSISDLTKSRLMFPVILMEFGILKVSLGWGPLSTQPMRSFWYFLQNSDKECRRCDIFITNLSFSSQGKRNDTSEIHLLENQTSFTYINPLLVRLEINFRQHWGPIQTFPMIRKFSIFFYYVYQWVHVFIISFIPVV